MRTNAENRVSPAHQAWQRAGSCVHATYPGHDSLCHHHLNREMRGIADGNIIAADILSAIGNFQSAAAINIALGKILVHQITGRISRHDALSLLYNCHLLLQTLPGVKTELRDSGYIKYWHEETRRILSGPSDLDELTDAALLPNGWDRLHPPDRTPAPSPVPAPPAPAPLQSLPYGAAATPPAAQEEKPARGQGSPGNETNSALANQI